MTAQSRTLVDFAFADVAQELATTRKHLERVPDDQLDWRPHEKSKSLNELATHVAQAPGLSLMIAAHDEIDLASGPKRPRTMPSRESMVAAFDEAAAGLTAALAALDDAALERTWALKSNGQPWLSGPKGAILRTLGVSHIVHHRAQLGVYLRLLGVPVPGSYGPSADE